MKNTEIMLRCVCFFLFISCNNEINSQQTINTIGLLRNPDTVIDKLHGKAHDPDSHFLLARAYKMKKQYAPALKHFTLSVQGGKNSQDIPVTAQSIYSFMTSINSKSDLYNDAIYEMALIWQLYNKYEWVVKYCDLVRSDLKGLNRDCILLKAHNLSKMGKHAIAQQCLKELLKLHNDEESRSLILIRSASIYETAEQHSAAYYRYLEVLRNPASWQAGLASASIFRLASQGKIQVAPKEGLSVGISLYHIKKYREAIPYLDRYLGCEKNKKAIEYKIRCLVRISQNKQVDSLISMFGTSPGERVPLHVVSADEFWLKGDRNTATEIYRKIASYNIEPWLQHSLMRLARAKDDKKLSGNEAELNNYIQKYSDSHSEYFLWLLGKAKLRHNERKDAISIFMKSVKQYPNGRFSDRCRFWLFKLLSENNEVQSASEYAIEMPMRNPDSPYTYIILKRLSGNHPKARLNSLYVEASRAKNNRLALFYHALLMIKAPSSHDAIKRRRELQNTNSVHYDDIHNTIIKNRLSSADSHALKSLEKYFRIGHVIAIRRELKTIGKGKDSQYDKNIMLAHFGYKYNIPHYFVHAYLKLLEMNRTKENLFLMPRESYPFILPTPYNRCVNEFCNKYSIAPEEIYAIMKAETTFNPNAISPAGAVGLMQLMPATARDTARSIKLAKYDLFDPCISIQLGVKYYRSLSTDANKNPIIALAAYNAGKNKVLRWRKKQLMNDDDYFTELSPYAETRNYILTISKYIIQYIMIK